MKHLIWAVWTAVFFTAAHGQPVRVGVIEAVINTDRVLSLTVYRSADGERYVQLKDLSEMLGGSLSFNPKTKYTVMAAQGQNVYFYPDVDYLVYNTDRINLNAPILNAAGRMYVPESLLTMSEFLTPMSIETKLTADRSVLMVNYIDNVVLNYFIVRDEAEVQVEMRRPMYHEFAVDRGVVTLTFFGGRLAPKEYGIMDGILTRMTVQQVGGNAVLSLHPAVVDVDIRRSTAPGRVTVTVVRRSSSPPVACGISPSSAPDTVLGEELPPPAERPKVIVIDPGHGGRDPGAVGPSGTQEKHVNLAIAKKVRALLVSAGWTVYLTREDDTFVPLVERTAFANAKRADVFLSIHCNAAVKARSGEKGFEAYSLAEYATDPDAVAAERLENEAIRFEQPTKAQEKLQKLLWSLVLNEYMNDSSRLCGLIAREVVQRTDLKHRGVKQAGFYVLRGAQMPAVLLECGFISNPFEEARLMKPEFQMSIADGIASGIRQYHAACAGR
jgi:N-acetylmuramoyl-L-alanine amidase